MKPALLYKPKGRLGSELAAWSWLETVLYVSAGRAQADLIL